MVVMIPNFKYEKKLWADGYEYIAGVDEVGRGAWAGPLVAGAAVFSPKVLDDSTLMKRLSSMRDSKKLSSKKRQSFIAFFDRLMKKQYLHSAVAEANPATINVGGVTKATGRAMRCALEELSVNLQASVDHTLVDAFPIDGIGKNKHTPIKKGDEKSVSIAAASIIAKEYRDDLMKKHAQAEEFSVYGWQTNVGYGTKKHREAIAKHGVTKRHRKLFVPEEILS